MCVRVYAVTQKNKLVVGALSVLMAAQHIFAIWFIAKNAMTPSESPNHFSVCVRTHIGF
jgi:hypothetical protein